MLPFEITTRKFGQFDEFVITDLNTQNSCAIIPELGGIVRELILTKSGQSYSLLKMPDTPDLLKNDTQSYSELLFPFASRIPEGKYTFEGIDYQLNQNDPNFPAAIHGLVRKKTFQVSDKNVCNEYAEIELEYTLNPSEGYPFNLLLKIKYRLEKNGDFVFEYEAKNQGKKSAPVMFGWHPYFQLAEETVDDLEICIPEAKSVIFDQNMSPIGSEDIDIPTPYSLFEKSLDNCFVITQNDGVVYTELKSPKLDVALQIEQQPDQFKYLVIYTPPARDCVAIEPLTANVNSFNTGEGLHSLKEGNSINGEFKLRVI